MNGTTEAEKSSMKDTGSNENKTEYGDLHFWKDPFPDVSAEIEQFCQQICVSSFQLKHHLDEMNQHDQGYSNNNNNGQKRVILSPIRKRGAKVNAAIEAAIDATILSGYDVNNVLSVNELNNSCVVGKKRRSSLPMMLSPDGDGPGFGGLPRAAPARSITTSASATSGWSENGNENGAAFDRKPTNGSDDAQDDGRSSVNRCVDIDGAKFSSTLVSNGSASSSYYSVVDVATDDLDLEVRSPAKTWPHLITDIRKASFEFSNEHKKDTTKEMTSETTKEELEASDEASGAGTTSLATD